MHLIFVILPFVPCGSGTSYQLLGRWSDVELQARPNNNDCDGDDDKGDKDYSDDKDDKDDNDCKYVTDDSDKTKLRCKIERDSDLSNFLRHGVILVPDVKLKNISSVAHLVFAIRKGVVGGAN